MRNFACREKPVEDIILTANSVDVDDVLLPPSMINKINWFQTIYSLPQPKQTSISTTVQSHYYYRGKNPEYPQVGDTRIHFQCAGIPQGSTLGPADRVSCCIITFN